MYGVKDLTELVEIWKELWEDGSIGQLHNNHNSYVPCGLISKLGPKLMDLPDHF
jgi:hypothetical protein